jgi:hypothetical protein
MAALSDYAEKLLLDWLMTTGPATRPTTWFLALYTAAPSDSGGGTEVSTGGYARQAIAFGAAATPGGTTSNTGVVEFEASASWGTITHIGIFDASTSGNLLWHGEMTTPRTIGDGDKLNFAIGSVTLTLA